MSAVVPTAEAIKELVVRAISDQKGFPADALLSGRSFKELDQQFDSLSMLEIQLIIEEAFGIELEGQWQNLEEFPDNLEELVQLIFDALVARSQGAR